MEPVAAARVEVAVGVAPATYSGRPERAVMFTLAPVAGWRLASRRWSLLLTYVPLLRWRHPNLLGLNRPLLLHGAKTRYMGNLSRRVGLSGGLDWQDGEIDYLSVTQLLGESQTSGPQATVLRFTQIGATAGISHAYARRHQREIGASASRRWLANEGAVSTYPTQTDLGVNLIERYVASRRDDLSLALGLGTTLYDWGRESDTEYLENRYAMILSDPRPSQQRYDSGSIRTRWQRRLGRQSTMDVGTGVSGASRNQGLLSWYPHAQLGIAGLLNRDRQLQVRGNASAMGDAVLDQVYGGFRPIAGVAAGITVLRPGLWTLAFRLTATTAATLEPLGPERPESILRAEIPFTYALGSETSFEVGARAGSRGPHWAERPFRLTEQYAWLYAAIAWASRSRLSR
jgi:hypothetical protein